MHYGYDYYISAGTGAVLGYYGANRTSLSAFKSAITPQDANSLSTNPTFTSAGSTVATDYQLGVSVNGITGTGISVDYGSNPRASFVTVGAWERNQNKWKGTTSNDWNTSTNWTGNLVPDVDATIIFDDVPLQHCQMDQNRSVTNIINAQSTYRVVTNGHKLTVKGNLNFTNGAKIDASATNSTVEFAGTSQNIPAGSFYNDAIYNLAINNPNNVVLNGTLRLLNAITAPLGQLDATTSQPVVSYAGSTAQSIEGGRYLNDEVTKLTIDNASGVTLNTDFTVDTLLTINSGKYLDILTETQMNVLGTITNNAGASGIIIESDSLTANGTLIYHNLSSSPVLATVAMYTKAYYDAGGPAGYKYKWQYFGSPLAKIPANPTFAGSYLRKWVESGTTISNHWVSLLNTDSVTAFKGYEITQVYPKFLYFEGQLVNNDYNSGQLPYTSSALYPGQNVLANPYTAAVDIRTLNFGSQMEWTVYMYNTGSYNDWNTSGGGVTPGNSPGQYTAVPIFTAGLAGLPVQIPSMQAFLVKAMSNSVNATLNIPYSSSVMKNTDLQRSKRRYAKSSTTSDKSFITIDVKGSRFSDRMWIFSDPTCTHYFDNGWDGVKAFGSALYPQIFAVEADGNYQTNSVDDINNTEIGFNAGEDSIYVLTFTHDNMSSQYPSIYLLDLQNDSTIDISQSGTEYSFIAHQTTNPVTRFKIVTSTGITTGKGLIKSGTLNVFSSGHTIFVHNLSDSAGNLKLYDISGQVLQELPFNAAGITTLPVNLASGLYVAKCSVNNKELVKRIILN